MDVGQIKQATNLGATGPFRLCSSNTRPYASRVAHRRRSAPTSSLATVRIGPARSFADASRSRTSDRDAASSAVETVSSDGCLGFIATGEGARNKSITPPRAPGGSGPPLRTASREPIWR